MTNKELSNLFGVLADLMEIHDENSFKIRSYSNAAFRLSRLEEEVIRLERAQLESIQGIGKAIADKIIEIRNTGQLSLLEKYLEKTPDGILDLIRIKGLGPKKISRLWKELDITNPGELLYACKENRLAALKGFGIKTQEKTIEAVEFFMQQKDKLLLHIALKEAAELKSTFEKAFEPAEVIPTGQLRRKSMTIDSFDFLISTDDEDRTTGILLDNGFEQFEHIFEKKAENAPVTRFHICKLENKNLHLFLTTGPDFYTKKVMEKIDPNTSFENESNIYQTAGMPEIAPENRENPNVFDYPEKRLKNRIEISDFKGMIHAHSTYSDGMNTISEMTEHCIEMGMEYLVLTDHSKSAFYAGGLSEEKIHAQHQEINKLNKTYNNFTILKGIESDILTDGSLDYANDVLNTFDCIIASVHSGFQMNEERATERLIKAIEHPSTNILGHLTGRLLLARNGYPVNHVKVIEACAKNQVAIELNANPYRLDIDWKWLDEMLDKGVMISINPDAHSINGFNDTKYGIIMANKAFWPKDMLLNALNTQSLIKFFSK